MHSIATKPPQKKKKKTEENRNKLKSCPEWSSCGRRRIIYNRICISISTYYMHILIYIYLLYILLLLLHICFICVALCFSDSDSDSVIYYFGFYAYDEYSTSDICQGPLPHNVKEKTFLLACKNTNAYKLLTSPAHVPPSIHSSHEKKRK